MKKKIIILLAIITIVMTGCVSIEQPSSCSVDNYPYVTINNEQYKLSSLETLKDMSYRENYVDFNTDAIGNTRIMRYRKSEELFFEIRVTYEEEHSIDEIKNLMKDKEEKSKIVNGINYIYYEYKNDEGYDTHYYLYEYKNVSYSFIFFLGDNAGDIESVFMNNVIYN